MRTLAAGLILLAGACGGQERAAVVPTSGTAVPSAPPQDADEPPPTPEQAANCAARVNHLDGLCFPTAHAACAALRCQSPSRCSFAYSMPVVVSCE